MDKANGQGEWTRRMDKANGQGEWTRRGCLTGVEVKGEGGRVKSSLRGCSYINKTVTVAMMLGWLVGITFVQAQTMDARVQRKLAELEGKGVPTTQEAIWKKVKVVLPEDNAAPLLIAAGAKVVVPARADARVPYLSKAVAPDVTLPLAVTDVNFGKAWLTQNAGALQALSVALKKPECLFQAHGSKLSRSNDEKHFQEVAKLARLLALKSHVHTGEGNVNGAIDAIADLMKLSDFLRNEPTMVAYLTRLAVDTFAASATEQLIGRRALNENQLGRLTKLFANESYAAHLQFGLASEIVMSRPLMTMSAKDFLSSLLLESAGLSGDAQVALPPGVDKAAEEHGKDGRNHLDAAMFLEQMGVLIEAAEKPFKDAVQMEEAVKAKCDEAKQKRFLMTSSFVTALAEMAPRQAEAIARQRLLLAALAIEQHRLKNLGRMPESLEGLAKSEGKAVWEDPFAKGALRFRKLPRGYVVYSVASDGENNNGVKKPEAGKGRPYDIVVRVGR
jgi:hypothetical protein